MGAGFLATPPPATRVPGAVQGYYGWCPPLSGTACLQPGDTFNPFRDLALDEVVLIEGHGYKEPFEWVFDRGQLLEILGTLDADVRVREQQFDTESDTDQRSRISLSFTWVPGTGAFDGEFGRLDFRADNVRNLAGFGSVEWDVSPEFRERLTRFMTEVSPTPEPTPTPTPEIVPSGAVFLDHRSGDLSWDGPSPHVRSEAGGHCERPELRAEFGIPALITIEDQMAFWAIRAVRRQTAWRWTGHSYDAWEIWQGDNPETIYIVSRNDERIAFEYKALACF